MIGSNIADLIQNFQSWSGFSASYLLFALLLLPFITLISSFLSIPLFIIHFILRTSSYILFAIIELIISPIKALSKVLAHPISLIFVISLGALGYYVYLYPERRASVEVIGSSLLLGILRFGYPRVGAIEAKKNRKRV